MQTPAASENVHYLAVDRNGVGSDYVGDESGELVSLNVGPRAAFIRNLAAETEAR